MGKIEIDFRVIGNDTYDNAFKIMKEYQNAGMADKNSCIIFENSKDLLLNTIILFVINANKNAAIHERTLAFR